MMSDQEMNERINAMMNKARDSGLALASCQYAITDYICNRHQFTAAAEGLLEAAERMVGIERGEKE